MHIRARRTRSRRTRIGRRPPAARAPSTPVCRAPRPRAVSRPARARGTARGSTRTGRARESFGCGPLGLLGRVRDLGPHVFLVVLSYHFLGDACPGLVERAAGYDPLPLAEQVRQHAGVGYRDLVDEIGEHKVHRETPGLLREAVVDDETAQT